MEPRLWTNAEVAELQRWQFPGGYCALDTRQDFRFNVYRARQAVNFGPTFFRHVKGALGDEPFNLEAHQAAFIANLFGWEDADGLRRYRMAYREIGRGNGKSMECTVVAGCLLYLDDEPGAEIFSAAGTRDQAKEVFGPFKLNVLGNPALKDVSQCYQNSVVRLDERTGLPCGSYKAIAADADFSHGGSPHGVIFDEFHVQKNRDLWDVLHTGKIKRRQPLTVAITTAGFDRHSICYEQRLYAERVRDGVVDDPRFLPMIYAADTEDDWTDPAVWRKANPNLGVSIFEEYLADECAKAQDVPAYENTFKRLHLNIWTEQDVRAIPMKAWDACGQDEDPIEWRRMMLQKLARQPCVGGLDLGSTGDLTALVLLFGHQPPFIVLPFFWVPEESALKREKRDRVPYPQWIRQGFIAPTSWSTTDYGRVRLDIEELAKVYSIREIAVDRLFQGAQLCTELMADGHEVVQFGQGFLSMAAPTKEFLELVLAGGILHGNNPVLRWMAGNAATVEDDHGNLKFTKKKSTERIDGIVTTVMALGRKTAIGPPQTSRPYSGAGTGVWG